MIDYFYDAYVILNKVYSEGSFVKQAISSTIIEEKYRNATVKTVYGVLDRDIELSYYIKLLSDKNPKLVIRTILKISIYTIKYLKKAPYAVIDSAVELTKKLGKKAMSGFVNAVLRRFCREDLPMPCDNLERLSVEYSYPDYAVKMLISDYGEDVAKKIMSYENDSSYLAFFNYDGHQYLNKNNIAYNLTPFENLFEVKNFTRNEGFEKGIYTYQNIGSFAICDVVDGGDNLIDVCSAPGGKSVNLSYKFNNVTSLELHEHRVELIKKYCQRMKVTNVTALQHDSTFVRSDFVGKFDACLCDVPCSGFGVVFENPDIKLNREVSSIQELCNTQYAILEASSKYVKTGGYLYYSTCSVFKCENQLNVDKFLENHKDFIQEEIDSKLPNIKIGKGVQFLPHISGGGFFVAKLKKIN